MRLLPVAAHPKTRGLDRRADLTDPHTTTQDITKVLSRN
jgi:hypothetical protein